MKEIKLGRYRHFKGNVYTLIATAKHSESGELFAVYRAEYGDGEVWIRPLDMFFEKVERDGAVFDRFTYIDE